MNWGRLWVLILKELRQIRRNRALIISLVVPPTLQLIIFGFALNPTVNHLRLGIVDESRTAQSRDLIYAFTANKTFVASKYFDGVRQLQAGLDRGRLDAGLVIPADFARQRMRAGANVQILIDAMNANTAAISQAYAASILQAYDEDIAPSSTALTTARVALLYNPGLETSWFIVCGTLGVLLVLNGSLVAAATTIREKDVGTLEQLLMTPAQTSEIIIAKIAPLFVLLLVVVLLGLSVAHTVFALPVRGSLALFLFAGALCVLVGISIGTFVGTFARTTLQAQLMSFFVNPPLALLSGSTTPIEAMPTWMQPLTLFNPIRHFATIARCILIKGVGIEVLYPNFLALMAFAAVLVTISVRRFRKQLE